MSASGPGSNGPQAGGAGNDGAQARGPGNGAPQGDGPGGNGPQAGRPATAAEPRTLMRWIVGSSLRFRHLVVFAAVGMIALGVAVLPNMHVEVFPEFAPPR